MSPVAIRALTLKNLIAATKTDNVEKFAKFCRLVSDLINHATAQREENKNEDITARVIQPQVAFHRSDSDRVFIIHHILSNSAIEILKYVIHNMTDWDEVNLQHSLEIETYNYLHLCAFALYYDENVEEANTTEGEMVNKNSSKALE